MAGEIESPKYEVIKAFKTFEVRRYPSYVVAQTQVEAASRTDAGNEAFRRLGGYIFGGNKTRSSIAMTAPVTQSQRIDMTAPVTQQETGSGTSRKWTVQFSMPSAFSLSTLPTPNDPLVELSALPERVVSVIRYSGTWSEENYKEHLEVLTRALGTSGLSTQGEPLWARYDPPFKPWFMRTNEIQLELTAESVAKLEAIRSDAAL